jgi:hypothetical protein
MLYGSGIFTLAAFILFAYCVFDVIRTEESTVQNLPKMIWLLIVIFIPIVGPLAWLLLGRPANAGFQLRGEQRSRPAPPSGPPSGLPERPPPTSSKDHEARREEALRRYMAEREEQLRRREEEVRRLEDELRRRERPEPEET